MNTNAPPVKKGFRERFLEPVRSRVRPTSYSSVSPTTKTSSPSVAPTAARTSLSILSLSSSTRSGHVVSSSSQHLLQAALQRLSDQDRNLIQKYIPADAAEVDTAFNKLVEVAQEQQRQYRDKRWTFKFGRRTITLQEEADKVVRWLHRFKTVGDVVVNADPVHVGLPWAGIRLLLEIAMTDANQRASLLVGCELALFMSSRLQLYFEFLLRMPETRARQNLETAMINLYVCILNFLAHTFRIYNSSSTRRLIDALLRESDIAKFESRCDTLAARAEIEASNCDRNLFSQFAQQAISEIEKLHGLQQVLDRIETKIDLDKINRLPYAAGAEFNPYDVDFEICHPGTRLDVLHQITDWAQKSDGKCIFWLNGMAGTGKSTISRTVADWASSSAQKSKGIDLGASFFFKRGEGDRGTATRFFSTVIRQLTERVPALAPLVAQAIGPESDTHGPLFGEQFEKLIHQPLQALSSETYVFPTFMIVIDALDECEPAEHIRAILQLCSRLSSITTIRLRLFLTSRPELPIRLGFKKMSGDTHQDMVLHDIPRTVIHHDIFTFLQDSFVKIREDYNDSLDAGESLDHTWPGDVAIRQLTDMAVPLFIAAATICRFIGDPSEAPQRRLQYLLDLQQVGGLSQMEKTYLPVLQQLPMSRSESSQQDRLYGQFRMIVGAIVTMNESLSISSLAALLGIPVDIVESTLRPLHSVLNISTGSEKPVRILHQSFAEFMQNERIANHKFAINKVAAHQMLLTQCLRVLSDVKGLRQDICRLTLPGRLRRDIDPTVIRQCLSLEVQYACHNWLFHAFRSESVVLDGGAVHEFLRCHFLHWLEALSLMERLPIVFSGLGDLQLMAPEGSQLSRFIEDARRFALANRHLVNLAPLQLYSSAIAFCPQNSVVRNVCGKIPQWIRRLPVVPQEWSLELQKLEGHTDMINAVAISPDGKLLASASSDNTVRLWNMSTGQEVQELRGHESEGCAVVFSPDNRTLASALYDNTTRLWDVSTGQEVQTLSGHSSRIAALAYSPNGKLLASASWDETIRLWDVNTGQEVQKLEGHTREVSAVAFSPDGTLLISTSRDGTVMTWDPSQGREVQKSEGFTIGTSAVAFSSNGKLLASASANALISLWDIDSCQMMQKLGGHTGIIHAVAFSGNDKLLASASADKTIRLWDVSSGQQVQILSGHTDWIYALAFTLDGKLLVSASGDKTARLWDTRTRGYSPAPSSTGEGDIIRLLNSSPEGGLLASVSSSDPSTITLWDAGSGQTLLSLKGHTDTVEAVAFSPDGKTLASGSWDQTVVIWDTGTGHEVWRLEGDAGGISAVAISPDGELLASAFSHSIILIHDLLSRKELQRVHCYTNNNLEFTDCGSSLMVDYRDPIPIGPFALRRNPSAKKIPPRSPHRMRFSKEWVLWEGENLLWLPHEYRTCLRTVRDNTAAFALSPGRIDYLEIEYP